MLGTIPPVGMLPGSLQLLNIIPTNYFGTTLMAAPASGHYNDVDLFCTRICLPENDSEK